MDQKKIAKLAGVSTATVSRVVNNYAGVSEKTKKKVMKVIRENMYVHNMSARNLRSANSKTIGFLISNFSNPFFIVIYEGLEAVCRSRGYSILIGNTNEDVEQERKAIDHLLSHRVDGIVASFVNPSQYTLDRLNSLNTKVLMLDRKIDGLDTDTITIDNIGGAQTQVSYLMELGHRDIAVIHGSTNNSPGEERLKGYYLGMEAGGAKVNPGYVIDGDFTEERAYNATIQLMSLSPRPTAVAVHNNLMCMGAYKALIDLNIKIPQDVSLIGFDDFDLASYLPPGITLISRPIKEMGILAAETLLDRIESKGAEELKKVEFPSKLKVRGSCAGVSVV